MNEKSFLSFLTTLKNPTINKSEVAPQTSKTSNKEKTIQIMAEDQKIQNLIVIDQRDLFEGIKKDDVIMHCISRDGALSQGFAKQLVSKFGYRDELLMLGKEKAILLEHNGQKILHLITKDKKYDKPTLKTLKEALIEGVDILMLNKEKSVIFPKIGAGLDKLDFAKVKNIINEVFQNKGIKLKLFDYDIKVEINYETGDILPQIPKKEKYFGPQAVMVEIDLTLKTMTPTTRITTNTYILFTHKKCSSCENEMSLISQKYIIDFNRLRFQKINLKEGRILEYKHIPYRMILGLCQLCISELEARKQPLYQVHITYTTKNGQVQLVETKNKKTNKLVEVEGNDILINLMESNITIEVIQTVIRNIVRILDGLPMFKLASGTDYYYTTFQHRFPTFTSNIEYIFNIEAIQTICYTADEDIPIPKEIDVISSDPMLLTEEEYVIEGNNNSTPEPLIEDYILQVSEKDNNGKYLLRYNEQQIDGFNDIFYSETVKMNVNFFYKSLNNNEIRILALDGHKVDDKAKIQAYALVNTFERLNYKERMIQYTKLATYYYYNLLSLRLDNSLTKDVTITLNYNTKEIIIN